MSREGKRCEYCERTFERPSDLSHAQWASRRFCSNSCSTKARPRRRAKYPELADVVWLRAKYVAAGMTIAAIAAELGASTHTVRCALNRNGIELRPQPNHGHARGAIRSLTYKSWTAMLQRCLNPRNASYFKYGERGITVCDRWRSFENFLADMGERSEGLTLDRIDGEGNYEPGNCRWATWVEQNRNRRFGKKKQRDREPSTVWGADLVPEPPTDSEKEAA